MTVSVTRDLQAGANPAKAAQTAQYLQAVPGGYGEGDQFIGLTVPQVRSVVKKYPDLPYADILTLLHSPIHEYRLTALLILVKKFENNPEDHKKIVELYISNTKYVNNWDLVDSSAAPILGRYVADKSRKILYTLAESKNLWERRIAIVATHALIKQEQFADTFALCEKLIYDKHDLIHKACGWMLREVANKNKTVVERWLVQRIRYVPRTTLRYAIEKFPQAKRKQLMAMR